jgi:glyoxylate utilization-related uncharacterized protein
MRRWGPNGPAEVMPALSHGWWKGSRGPKPLTADFGGRGRGFNALSVTATHAQQVNTLLTKQLPEAPRKEIEVITVNYAPGAVDTIHRHDAHAVVYVLEGEVEMQVRGGMLQRLGPGRYFTNHLKTFIP